MAASRSPRYPNISLNEAISKAKMIYQKEHMSAMTPPVAAEAMGYTGINGSSLKTISSLKKYGLLDGRADDVRLTKDAQTLILDDPTTSDYRTAMNRVALAPEIFGEIHKQFQGGGSERNIAVYLEKQGFMPDAASIVAKHYKESAALVSMGGPTYSGDRDDEQPEAPMSQAHSETPVPRSFAPAPPAPVGAAGLPRVIQDGKLLQISATVDLKGLRKLKLMLDNYEKLLVMFEDDEAPESNLDISQELNQ